MCLWIYFEFPSLLVTVQGFSFWDSDFFANSGSDKHYVCFGEPSWEHLCDGKDLLCWYFELGGENWILGREHYHAVVLHDAFLLGWSQAHSEVLGSLGFRGLLVMHYVIVLGKPIFSQRMGWHSVNTMVFTYLGKHSRPGIFLRPYRWIG